MHFMSEENVKKLVESTQQIMLVALAYSYEDISPKEAMDSILEVCLKIKDEIN